MARERDAVYSENSLLEVFDKGAKQADGRDAHGLRHQLSSMLIIMLIGFLLKLHSLRGLCRYFSREENLAQLKTFLDLPFGVPSPSCYSRTLAVMDPFSLVTCYADFLYQLIPHTPDQPQHLCADGKAVNAAENRALTGKSLYIVNIFHAALHLFTYQVRVGAKKQEGKVLEQEIYDILYQDPSLVTADAMATKKAILDLICEAGSDAVLPVKANNKNLMKGILDFICPLAEKNESVDHYLDLNGFSESDIPSRVIDNTQCKVYDEDNRKEPDADGEHPVETHEFFDKIYKYETVKENETPQIKEGNKKLAYFRVGDRWVPMAHDHGRWERREYELLTDPTLINQLHEKPALEGWDNVEAVGIVTRYRAELKRDKADKKEVRYYAVSITRTPYILTIKPESAKQFADIVRAHWSVEEAHHTLDEHFLEDRCTVRKGNAPETCSLIRKIAYNLISMLEYKSQQNGKSEKDRPRRFKETLENVVHEGISGLKNLLTRRFRSPYLS